MPLLGAVLTAALVVTFFLAFVPRLQRDRAASRHAPEAEQLRQLLATGSQKLAEGRFRTACEDFSTALALHEQHPEWLTPTESRQLHDWHQQSDLLARLLTPSLQKILREAIQIRHEDEWQARFNDDYKGKAVVFDDTVGRDPDGRPVLRVYAVWAEPEQAGALLEDQQEKARVALEDLTLFHQLPLEPPQRLLFGARLASLSREQGGRWVFRFQPESGVLLTDPGAVAACDLGPLDAEVLEVLRRQKEWLRR